MDEAAPPYEEEPPPYTPLATDDPSMGNPAGGRPSGADPGSAAALEARLAALRGDLDRLPEQRRIAAGLAEGLASAQIGHRAAVDWLARRQDKVHDLQRASFASLVATVKGDKAAKLDTKTAKLVQAQADVQEWERKVAAAQANLDRAEAELRRLDAVQAAATELRALLAKTRWEERERSRLRLDEEARELAQDVAARRLMRSGIALLAAMAVVGTLQDIFFQFSAVVAVVLLGPVVVAATVLGYYIDPSRSKASPSPTQVPVPPDSSDLTCLICMDMPRDTLIRPCNHVVLCGACSADARLRSCPVCRGPVRSVEKVYT